MASKSLYPAIVDSYMPAFETTAGSNNSCRIYFRLSKFNSYKDIENGGVHATVVKQSTNMNIVKKTDDPELGKYRSTGIILNLGVTPVEGEDNLYFVTIDGSDLYSKAEGYEGWIPDWTYKVQIRLSSVRYDGSIGQAAWLNANAQNFSEWSTVCIVKAIHHITYTIDQLNIDTSDENQSSSANNDTIISLYSATLFLTGKFDNCGNEDIYKYSFVLYDYNDDIIENSGDIYANQFQDNKSFNYLVKTELKSNVEYKLEFKFETVNHFIGGAYRYYLQDEEHTEIDNRYRFTTSVADIDHVNCRVVTVENDTDDILKDITNIHLEEEDGRIGLKLYVPGGEIFSGNLCLRRADASDNFQTWTDIKIFILKAENINDLPLFYDYTAESGVWYKYGVQKIDKNGNRGRMNIVAKPILRNYNYSFLLGKNNQQLKLMFDNIMPTYKIQLQESKIDPIGSTYPTVTRNAATRYRLFPINGLISFWMDENKTFCDKKVIYKYNNIIDEYENYNEENNIVQYDYIYERDFRKLVLDFLHDGEFKLFKSPTEGNIIVRLTDINCTPNQSLDRMLYSFSSTAHEMAEATMENYLKYGFYDPGKYGTDFSVLTTRIGQLQMDFPVNTNIIGLIYDKYDGRGRNIGGYSKILQRIHHIKITFEDLPLRILNNSNEYVLGNNFILNGQKFTVYAAGGRIYEFDERLTYNSFNNLSFLSDAENKVSTVRATIDFLYDMSTEIYEPKQKEQITVKSGIGQIFNEFNYNTNIYNVIYIKYYIDTERVFRELNTLTSIEIEANPGVVISIRDESEKFGEPHMINETGQLRFEDIAHIDGIKYLGIMNPDGTIDSSKPADILINYQYIITKGTYKVIS